MQPRFGLVLHSLCRPGGSAGRLRSKSPVIYFARPPVGKQLYNCLGRPSWPGAVIPRCSYHGPATVKALKCKIDQKSGSFGLDFEWKSAPTMAGKVDGARGAVPATFPANLWADFRAKSGPDEPLPRSILHLSDFTVAGPLFRRTLRES